MVSAVRGSRLLGDAACSAPATRLARAATPRRHSQRYDAVLGLIAHAHSLLSKLIAPALAHAPHRVRANYLVAPEATCHHPNIISPHSEPVGPRQVLRRAERARGQQRQRDQASIY